MLILLDIDGVMVPAKSWELPTFLNDGFPAFSINATRVLQKIITKDTTVILISSHRIKYSIDEWKKIFMNRGITINKLEKLQSQSNDSYHFISRKDEVQNWYDTNFINEDFIIIDDDKSLNSLPLKLKDKLILTNPMIGLTEEHLSIINSIH